MEGAYPLSVPKSRSEKGHNWYEMVEFRGDELQSYRAYCGIASGKVMFQYSKAVWCIFITTDLFP